MAAIDKTYVNKEQLLQAIEWAKSVGVCLLENGYEFKPLDFIYGYNDLDNPHYFDDEQTEYVLWNTPQWFDRWLWINCPLNFVKDRLQFQYGKDSLKKFENFVYCNPKNNLDFGKQHYTFLKIPSWHGLKWLMNHDRRDNPYPGKCIQLTYIIEIFKPRKPNSTWTDNFKYNCETDTWEKECGLMPAYDDYIWQEYHKNIPSKKAIIRQLRKWYIPKGFIVRIYQFRYENANFEILVK